MFHLRNMIILSILAAITLIIPVEGIKCFVCSSNEHTHCTEKMDVERINLEPQECDSVYEARYCVKTTGMFKGEVGTSRFCSAVDMGTICDFQQRKGDVREYRACVYSCTGDGCNGSHLISASLITITVFLLLPLINVRVVWI